MEDLEAWNSKVEDPAAVQRKSRRQRENWVQVEDPRLHQFQIEASPYFVKLKDERFRMKRNMKLDDWNKSGWGSYGWNRKRNDLNTFEEKELKAEEDKLKQLKRERLKREKILYEREKKVLEMKEKQLWGETRTVPFELDRPWTHRTVARDASICRVITKYPANEEKTLARRSACTSSSRDQRDESVGSSCSLHTSSSRSVFEGNRLGEKMSAKKRLGIRRRSSSRSAKKRLGIRKRSRSSSRY